MATTLASLKPENGLGCRPDNVRGGRTQSGSTCLAVRVADLPVFNGISLLLSSSIFRRTLIFSVADFMAGYSVRTTSSGDRAEENQVRPKEAMTRLFS